MKQLILAAMIVLATQVAHTSKEGVLSLDSFVMTSKGIGPSGEIKVAGTKSPTGKFEKIEIEAFGKTLAIDPKLLEKIPQNMNGLQLTYETGYEKLGGKTIYLIFRTGFTSSDKEKYIISVNEQGKSERVLE